MMSKCLISLLIFVISYNLIILAYCIKEGWKDLSKEKKFAINQNYLKPPKIEKYSACYETSNELFYIYDGQRWIDEIEIENLKTIVSNERNKKKKNLSCGFKLSPEDARERFNMFKKED